MKGARQNRQVAAERRGSPGVENSVESLFFDGWKGLLGTLIAAPVLYALVVLAVRVSGKRTTGEMNNFDWIVTVAIGSIVASGIVIERVAIAEAASAVFALIALQYALTKLSQRSSVVDRTVKARPKLLAFDGALLSDALASERVTEDELMAKLRGHGIARLSDVGAVVLENDGTFSVLHRRTTARGRDDRVLPDELRAA